MTLETSSKGVEHNFFIVIENIIKHYRRVCAYPDTMSLVKKTLCAVSTKFPSAHADHTVKNKICSSFTNKYILLLLLMQKLFL